MPLLIPLLCSSNSCEHKTYTDTEIHAHTVIQRCADAHGCRGMVAHMYKQTHSCREAHTETYSYRGAQTHTNTQRHTQKHRYTQMHTDAHIGVHTHCHSEVHRHTEIHECTQRDTRKQMHTDRQMYAQMHMQIHTDRADAWMCTHTLPLRQEHSETLTFPRTCP